MLPFAKKPKDKDSVIKYQPVTRTQTLAACEDYVADVWNIYISSILHQYLVKSLR